MSIPTREAASQLGVSQRQVQRLVQSGRIAGNEIAGRKVVARTSLVAASRTMERGRRWNTLTAAAAAELLEKSTTSRMAGSQLSRLKARLRSISVAELAYHALGNRVTLWRQTGPTTTLASSKSDGLASTGEGFTVTVARNAKTLARRERLLEDTEGTILLIEIDTDVPAVFEDIALFAYGDTRTSSAAKARIEARQVALK